MIVATKRNLVWVVVPVWWLAVTLGLFDTHLMEFLFVTVFPIDIAAQLHNFVPGGSMVRLITSAIVAGVMARLFVFLGLRARRKWQLVVGGAFLALCCVGSGVLTHGYVSFAAWTINVWWLLIVATAVMVGLKKWREWAWSGH